MPTLYWGPYSLTLGPWLAKICRGGPVRDCRPEFPKGLKYPMVKIQTETTLAG